MAGRGPAPKAEHSRRRDTTRRTSPRVTVVEDEVLRGPELPPLKDGWPAPTQAWWDNWRRSPQAQTMTTTDWDFLTDTALLHARFWSGDAGVAAELRLRVAKFGATPEDRQRLRMQIGEPEKPADESVPKQSRYAHLRSVE